MFYILSNYGMQTLFPKAVNIYQVNELKGGALLQLSEWQQTGTLGHCTSIKGHWDTGTVG